MKKLLLLLAIPAILTGCSSTNEKYSHDDLYFANDFESMLGWTNADHIVKGDAHSGKYFSKTDSSCQFSQSFRMNVGDVSDVPLKSVEVKAWANILRDNFKGSLVISVNRGDSSVFYYAADLKSFFNEKGKWFQVSAKVDLPQNFQKSDKFMIYLWNINGKSEIRVDDFEIQFHK